MSKKKGELYRKLRKAAGLTQSEVAAAIGIDHTMLSKIESGARSVSHRLLPKMAQALGVQLARLISWSDPPLCAHKVPRSDTWQPEEVSQFAFVMGEVEVGEGARIGHFVVLDGTEGKVVVEAGAVVDHGVQLKGPCSLNADGIIKYGKKGVV